MREDVKQPHVFIADITKILPDFLNPWPDLSFPEKR
jgi:hypothetical protein